VPGRLSTSYTFCEFPAQDWVLLFFPPSFTLAFPVCTKSPPFEDAPFSPVFGVRGDRPYGFAHLFPEGNPIFSHPTGYGLHHLVVERIFLSPLLPGVLAPPDASTSPSNKIRPKGFLFSNIDLFPRNFLFILFPPPLLKLPFSIDPVGTIYSSYEAIALKLQNPLRPQTVFSSFSGPPASSPDHPSRTSTNELW